MELSSQGGNAFECTDHCFLWTQLPACPFTALLSVSILSLIFELVVRGGITLINIIPYATACTIRNPETASSSPRTSSRARSRRGQAGARAGEGAGSGRAAALRHPRAERARSCPTPPTAGHDRPLRHPRPAVATKPEQFPPPGASHHHPEDVPHPNLEFRSPIRRNFGFSRNSGRPILRNSASPTASTELAMEDEQAHAEADGKLVSPLLAYRYRRLHSYALAVSSATSSSLATRRRRRRKAACLFGWLGWWPIETSGIRPGFRRRSARSRPGRRRRAGDLTFTARSPGSCRGGGERDQSRSGI